MSPDSSLIHASFEIRSLTLQTKVFANLKTFIAIL